MPTYIGLPGWTFWLIDCEDVFVRGIRVMGCQQMINNDGIDIDGCRRVTVSDSVFRTGDDCLVLRAIRKGPSRRAVCEEVTVTNCVLDSWCQGIRVGCPSDDTIRNCLFSNIVIPGRGNGININNPRRYLRDDCSGYPDLRDILFANMVIDTGGVPIWINVEEGVRLRHLGELMFSNVRIRSDHPCRLEGSPETRIEDMRFSHIRCTRPIEMSRTRRIRLHEVEVEEAWRRGRHRADRLSSGNRAVPQSGARSLRCLW
ncbi:MAG: glycosyl hydrolase family 28 protein [Planctomycetota bacterium]